MVHHVKELDHLDHETEFLPHFAHEGAFQGLAEFNAAPRELPFVLLIPRFLSAFREKESAILVKDNRAGSDTDVVDAFFHAEIITSFMVTVYNHLAIAGQFHYNFCVAKTTKKKWSLYMLKCGDGTLYTGITVNLSSRLEKHRHGTASKYTRSRLPVRIVHHETCRGRSDALKKEHAIKRLSRADKEVYIRKPWTIKR